MYSSALSMISFICNAFFSLTRRSSESSFSISLYPSPCFSDETFFPFVFAYWSSSSRCSFNFCCRNCKSRIAFFLVLTKRKYILHLCTELLIIHTCTQVLEHAVQLRNLGLQILKVQTNILN